MLVNTIAIIDASPVSPRGKYTAGLAPLLEKVNEALRCGDCGAVPGDKHVPGCDVERCKICGWQALGCDCPSPEGEYASTLDATFGDWKSTVWTGTWPGKEEMREFDLLDLNMVASFQANQLLVWDSDKERLVRNPSVTDEDWTTTVANYLKREEEMSRKIFADGWFS